MVFCWGQAQHLEERTKKMNKELALKLMIESFNSANLNLAINSGIEEAQAQEQITAMQEVIKSCMEKVLDTLVDNFSEITK